MCEVFVSAERGWRMCALHGHDGNSPEYPNPWPGHNVCSVHRKLDLEEILDRREQATVAKIAEFVRVAHGVINLEWQLGEVTRHWRKVHNEWTKKEGIGYWHMPMAEALDRECDQGFSGKPLYLGTRAYDELAKKIAAMPAYLPKADD